MSTCIQNTCNVINKVYLSCYSIDFDYVFVGGAALGHQHYEVPQLLSFEKLGQLVNCCAFCFASVTA